MVAPNKRNLKKKFVKVTKSTKDVRFRDKPTISSCAICKNILQGVPRGDLKKLSKTEKRPSIVFGGILCSKCRDIVFDNAIMLKLKIINENDVSLKYKNYVNTAILKIAK